METNFARFNIELDKNENLGKNAALWQVQLDNFAIEGLAEDYEVFFSEKNAIVGVSIPFDENPMSLLEAGSVLGYCLARYEQSDLDSKRSSWLSIHDGAGNVINSPVGDRFSD